jgi:protein O-mannosyl-transferase
MRRPLILAFFALVTVLAYWPAMHGPFVFDDESFVTGNPSIIGVHPISLHEPRALQTFILRVFYDGFGPNPFPFHLFGLALHLFNGWLVYRLAVKLGLGEELAMLAGALFWLHPAQTQAVIYIAQQSELLVGCATLLSLSALLSRRYLLAGMALGMGVLAKENGALILTLWILVLLYRQEMTRRVWAWIGITLAALLAWQPVYGQLWLLLRDAGGSMRHAGEAILLLSHYLIPVHLAIDHDFRFIPEWAGVLAIVLILANIVCAIRLRHTLLGFGVLWIAAWIVPHILLAPPGYFAEHHLYVPSIAISLMMAAGIQQFSHFHRSLLHGKRSSFPDAALE